MNKLHQWGAATIAVPRSLVLMILLFVVVLTIETFARHQMDKKGPIICPVCSCESESCSYPMR